MKISFGIPSSEPSWLADDLALLSDVRRAAYFAIADAVSFATIERLHHERNVRRWLDYWRGELERAYHEMMFEPVAPGEALLAKLSGPAVEPIYDARTGAYIGHFPVAPSVSILMKLPPEEDA